MTDSVIRATALTKHFGPVKALDGLDLDVGQAEIYGFLGPNGAGKSTTIRLILDLIRPTSGSVQIYGQSPDDGGPELRTRIGYLPGELTLGRRGTAGSLLMHLARLRNGAGAENVGPLAKRFDLDLDRKVATLSKGNKQKIGVIQAFMHRPDLLILDEPTSGLDPLLQHEFQVLAREAQADGATLFMSSHVLSEVEDIAERVGIIRAGRLVDVDDVGRIRHRAGQEVELRFVETVPASAFVDLTGVHDLRIEATDDGGTRLRCLLRGEPDDLLKAAARYRVVGWKAADRDFEDLFLDFYRDEVGHEVRRETDERGDVAGHG